jgi:glycosyltransferase involved in cell wall biosynthesis
LLLTLRSFESLDAATTPSWELIVVDNNSTDETQATVQGFAATARFNVRYAYEEREGLSNARNRGLPLARGAIVAFTDDDVRISHDWLTQLEREYSDPSVALVCGRTLPLRDDMFRLSIKDAPERAVYRHPSNPLGIGLGNNMSIRKSVADQIGLFDPHLGAGTRCGAAEDVDYIYRVLKAGHTVVYTPTALVYHDHDRVTTEQISKIQRNYRRGYGACLAKHILRGDGWMLKLGYWDQVSMLRGAKFGKREDAASSRSFLAETWRGAWYRLVDEVGELAAGSRSTARRGG